MLNYILSKSCSEMSALGYKCNRENGIWKIMVLCELCALDIIKYDHNFGFAEKMIGPLYKGVRNYEK